MQTLDITAAQEVYTVSQLNREVRLILEGSFTTLWIEGEISNFVAPNSGHWYFSLKDANAQIRCAMFRLSNQKLDFTPQNGMHVLLKARISLYEGRGDFQLLVDYIEEMGEGRLRQQFEALKKKLAAANLFHESHKKSLPLLPKTIGVVTSPTGAAIRDILSVLKRRYCCANIIIYPSLVQGSQAAASIVNALTKANERSECDVLIVARGGGSLEDLWPFNEEKVAYAIFASQIPIISGVGHEIDFTIADFVADVRAPTPSAAAELIAPHTEDLLANLTKQQKQMIRNLQHIITHCNQELNWTKKQLSHQHPQRRLAEQTQQLDLNEIALVNLQNKLLQQHRHQLQTQLAKLFALTPLHFIHQIQHQQHHHLKLLQTYMLKICDQHQQLFGKLAGKLNSLSPLATLERGFAIATRTRDNQVLRHAEEVSSGEQIAVRLMDGTLKCRAD